MTDTTHSFENTRHLFDLIEKVRKATLQETNPEHTFMKVLRDYYEAEGCVGLFIDPLQRTKFIKKELTTSTGWKITSEVELNRGMLLKLYKEGTPAEINDPETSGVYFPSIDGIAGIKSHLILASPVTSHGQKYGIIALINPKAALLESDRGTAVLLMTLALGDQLYYVDVMRDFKGMDDDLQVSKVQLLNSRNTLRTLFDNIPDSFYLVDPSYQLKAVNLSRANRTGKPPQKLVGKKCYEALFGNNKPCTICLVKEVVEKKAPAKLAGHHWDAEKEWKEWDINAYPIIDHTGAIDQVILLEQDMTEQRKLELELLQTEKLVAAGELAAGVTHEINNPLTAILANAQLLLLDIDPSQKDLIESVKLIEMAGRRATSVVKNLQGLVRKHDYEYQWVDLNESIQSALMLISHEFISRKINIRFNPDEDMPEILASRDHLQGAWLNLLMNAIEAIGEDPGEIKIDTLYENKNFYVEIKDTGSGIKEEDLGRIFEPFFSTKKAIKGTGLGLSLVKRIVSGHCGQVLVESGPGKGSRFTIVLPERSEQEVKAVSPELGLI